MKFYFLSILAASSFGTSHASHLPNHPLVGKIEGDQSHDAHDSNLGKRSILKRERDSSEDLSEQENSRKKPTNFILSQVETLYDMSVLDRKKVCMDAPERYRSFLNRLVEYVTQKQSHHSQDDPLITKGCYIIGSLTSILDGQNINQRLTFYEQAANQGDAKAQCNLGLMYKNGQGVEQDVTKAVEYYQLAAAQGHDDAASGLRLAASELAKEYHRAMFNNTSLSPQEVLVKAEQALEYYRIAIENGDIHSIHNLARLYRFPKGEWAGDQEKTLKYYRLAADKGHDNAANQLRVTASEWAQDYHRAMFNNTSLSPQEVLVKAEQALEYYRIAIENGDIQSMHNLARLYRFPKGEWAGDQEQAIKYYQLAAAQGYAESQYILGVYYYKGQGVEQDYEKAVEYFLLAADQGHAKSENALANIYEDGDYGLLDNGFPNLMFAASFLPSHLEKFYIHTIIKKNEIREPPLPEGLCGGLSYKLNLDFFLGNNLTTLGELKMHVPTEFRDAAELFHDLCGHINPQDNVGNNALGFLRSISLFEMPNKRIVMPAQKALFAYILQLKKSEKEDQLELFKTYLHTLYACNTGKEKTMMSYFTEFVDEDIKKLFVASGQNSFPIEDKDIEIYRYIQGKTASYIEMSLNDLQLHHHFGCENAVESSDLTHNIAYLKRVLSGHLFLSDPQRIDRHPHVVFNTLVDMSKQDLLERLYSYFTPSYFVGCFQEEWKEILNKNHDFGSKNFFPQYKISNSDFMECIGFDNLRTETNGDGEDFYSISEEGVSNVLRKVGLLKSVDEDELNSY